MNQCHGSGKRIRLRQGPGKASKSPMAAVIGLVTKPVCNTQSRQLLNCEGRNTFPGSVMMFN